MNTLSNPRVAIAAGVSRYPDKPPFDSPDSYPESPFKDRPLDPQNQVYSLVRESLRLLGMDEGRFGSPQWNPLGEVIASGDRVLIKPNFVLHRNAGTGPVEAVVTHASVLRAICDYVLIALGGKGEITIGDAPQMNCDLATLFSRNGMDGLITFLEGRCRAQGVRFSVVDFREEQTFYKAGIVWKRKPLGRDAQMTVPVTMGPESYMDEIDSSRLYGADYNRRQTVGAHSDHRHEYRIAREVLAADVVISVPKLKVHSKVGTTLNIKNMVGINTDKNHLAHYRIGPQREGGDEFSNPAWHDKLDRKLSDVLLGAHWAWGKYPFLGWRAVRKLWRLFEPARPNAYAYGNWHGNDTAWRMALDLNRILLTSDHAGTLHPSPARKYFSVIDGIIGGQGDGPLHPDACASGVIVAGFNPLAVDWVATELMGFNPQNIPMYLHAIEQMRGWIPELKVEELIINSNAPAYSQVLTAGNIGLQFAAAPGWRGRIERYSTSRPEPPALATDAHPISQ